MPCKVLSRGQALHQDQKNYQKIIPVPIFKSLTFFSLRAIVRSLPNIRESRLLTIQNISITATKYCNKNDQLRLERNLAEEAMIELIQWQKSEFQTLFSAPFFLKKRRIELQVSEFPHLTLRNYIGDMQDLW